MRVNVTWDQEDAAIALAATPTPTAEPAALRVACGLTLNTMATAIGVSKMAIWRWETGRLKPRGAAGERYRRVIAGLARHMEVTEDE